MKVRWDEFFQKFLFCGNPGELLDAGFRVIVFMVVSVIISAAGAMTCIGRGSKPIHKLKKRKLTDCSILLNGSSPSVLYGFLAKS